MMMLLPRTWGGGDTTKGEEGAGVDSEDVDTKTL
jgi:hypothetical protein